MNIGSRVRTLYQHGETAIIVKPRKVNLPLPGPDWVIVQFESDGKHVCCHRSMLTLCND